MVQEREAKVRAAEMVTGRPPTLQELMAQAQRDEVPELNLIVKADVQGSIGALVDALAKKRVMSLPDCGHAMMAEQPDAVLDALAAFL